MSRRNKVDVEQIGWDEQIREDISISGSLTITGSMFINNLGSDSNVLLVGPSGEISSTSTLHIDESNGRVGMNTTSPQEQFHIHGNNATLRLGNGNSTGEHSVKLELSEQSNADGNMNYGFSLGYDGSTNDFEIRKYANSTVGSTQMSIDRTTGIMTMTNPIGLTVVASNPSTVGNIAHIYAKDVSTSAEVFVQDEAGNVTQISPHNTEGEWQYFSKNVKTGKVVRVNMEKMIRKLEEITGESFIEEWVEKV
jgi:hypothetical protein